MILQMFSLNLSFVMPSSLCVGLFDLYFCKFPQRSFIPTMPQDDLADIKDALLAARTQNGNENPVLYRK